jgi:serine/threonine-protein kinase
VRESTFGKYRLVAELGQGGMADVILALAQGPAGFNKLVVVKRLRQHLAEDPEFVAMLVDEARLAARLNHPNIVHTNEVGEIDGRFFIAMEYLEGQPLTRIKRRATRAERELSVETELRVLGDVLAGLQYAHELTDYDGTPLGVVHRDVTPSNVFITYEGVVKIVDFGIAKASGRSTHTQTGVVKGKMPYMPPEQALGHEVDRRADIFSVGVMLWEVLARRRMWKGLDDVVILGRLINGDIPISPREVRPEIPEVLDTICRKALNPDPEGRYARAVDFQNDLEAYLETCSSQPTNRELGRVVSEVFEQERREIKSIIETQLSKIKDNLANSLEPVVIPESLPGTLTPSATEISPGRLESRRPSITGIPESLRSSTPSWSPAEEALTNSAYRGRRRRAALAFAAVAVAAAAGAVWLMGRAPSAERAPVEAVHPVTTAIPGPSAPRPWFSSDDAAPEDGRVRVTLRAVPAGARFSIDGGPWLDNPYVGEVEVDDGEHFVRIEARHHESKTVKVQFDKDVLLDVTLKSDAPVRYHSPRAQPPPSPAVVQPGSPGPRKPPRELNTEDPWTQ